MLHIPENNTRDNKAASTKGLFILLLVLVNTLVLKVAFVHDSSWYSALFITLPLLAAVIIFNKPKKLKVSVSHPINTKRVNTENTDMAEQIYEQNSLTPS
jgi:uncharacterized protein (DUF58 family)